VFFVGVTNVGMSPRESYVLPWYGRCASLCLSAPPLRSTSTIPALLESVDGGPEKGHNVNGKFPGPLGQQQAGFGGQRAGS
jgi:hypothetical protein